MAGRTRSKHGVFRPVSPPRAGARQCDPGPLPRRLRARLRAGWLLLATALGAASPSLAGDEKVEPGAHPLAVHLEAAYTADLEGVLERRYLRVLTSNNAFDYYIEDGRRRGFQYDMVRAFVRRLNERYPPPAGKPKIRFEMIPVTDGDLIPMLVAGRGDMIAARLTVIDDRAAAVAFSQPYHTVDEVVVQRRKAAPIADLRGMSGKKVSVRRSSSYARSLSAQNEKLRAAGLQPIRIQHVDDSLPTERILALVAQGALERTVADAMVAEAAAAVYPDLAVLSSVRLRENGRLAWAVPIGSEALLAEIDAFLPRYEEGTLHGNMAVQEYFQKLQPIRRRLESDDDSTISPWDDAFRRYAERYGFDWRLMAAMAWQESRFDQSARNRSGATGLFQIKPETAAEPYVDVPDVAGPDNAMNNIHAGIKYLAWIKQRYFDSEPDMNERDRVRMALAAYNAGPRTVARARLRAEKMGLDPDRWFRNVELAMLAMKRREPVRYVSEINQSYVAYLLLGYE